MRTRFFDDLLTAAQADRDVVLMVGDLGRTELARTVFGLTRNSAAVLRTLCVRA